MFGRLTLSTWSEGGRKDEDEEEEMAANSLLLLSSSPLHHWHTSAALTRLSVRGGVSQASGKGSEYSALTAGGT